MDTGTEAQRELEITTVTLQHIGEIPSPDFTLPPSTESSLRPHVQGGNCAYGAGLE